ncbi:DUF763 domain-containing protein [Candidatus Micrarchaeota archaeon]|nr:DUF763 domain-containing protein [Candidatus Micrarchaeota archaeon]
MSHSAIGLPLHPGKAPRWLFGRMVKLSKLISKYIINEYGEQVFMKRLADPLWFQSFGCVLGFDWHSSGLTTTTTAALKIALDEENLGIYVAGGKGRTSRKTPEQIINYGDRLRISEKVKERLVRTSRLTAKIDNSCIQDGYQLYHHVTIFGANHAVVIQQGMNSDRLYARRYHWYDPHKSIDVINSENENIISHRVNGHDNDGHGSMNVLDLASPKSKKSREYSLDIIEDMPRHHRVLLKYLTDKEIQMLSNLSGDMFDNYEELLLVHGIGPKKLRALALISQLVYGSELDWNDPVKFSFAHGGKDGHPFPVDRETYDYNISLLSEALDYNNDISGNKNYDVKHAIKRLYKIIKN